MVKQNETIIKLQNELKQAKGILHNPKLKLRVHNRLKDYIEEYENDEDEDSINGLKKNLKRASIMSKTFDNKLNLPKRKDLQFGSKFNSISTDANTSRSKFHTRRSTVPDGQNTRLSPLANS